MRRESGACRGIVVQLPHEVHADYNIVNRDTDRMHCGQIALYHAREKALCLVDAPSQSPPEHENWIHGAWRLVEHEGRAPARRSGLEVRSEEAANHLLHQGPALIFLSGATNERSKTLEFLGPG